MHIKCYSLTILLLISFISKKIDQNSNTYFIDSSKFTSISNNLAEEFEYHLIKLKLSIARGDQKEALKSGEEIIKLGIQKNEGQIFFEPYLQVIKENYNNNSQKIIYQIQKIRVLLHCNYKEKNYEKKLEVDWIKLLQKTKSLGLLEYELILRSAYAVYLELTEKKFNVAIDVYKENINIALEKQDSTLRKFIYADILNLGNLYQSLGQYQKAISNYKLGLNMPKSSSSNQYNQVKLMEWLSHSYEELDQLDSSLFWKKKQYSLHFNYQKLEQDKQIQELHEKYQNQKLTTSLSEEKFRLNRNRGYLAISLISLGFISFFFINRHRQAQLNETNLQNEIIQANQQAQINAIHAQMEGQEKERKRIAQVLHDQVAGYLSAVQLQFKTLVKDQDRIAKPMALIKEVNTQVRELSHDLYPPVLIQEGLTGAIQELTHQYGQSGIHFTIDSSINGLRFPEQIEYGLFDITRELVNNVIKHSQAKNCKVNLGKTNESLHLIVQDDGVGFPQKHVSNLGLSMIKARVQAMSGSFTILKVDSGSALEIKIDVT